MKYFTFNKKNKPVLSKCRNCGTETKGPYCHLCGQSLFAGKEGFTESFFNNVLSLYAIDPKIFHTIKLLLFYPGKLTKEYCQGHIIRYEHPFKLFWFVAPLFFLFFTYTFDPNSVKLSGDIEFNLLFMNLLPYETILLIPLFSLLLFVCFRKYEPKFQNHTVFALHFHTFLYVFFAGLLLIYHIEISISGWILLVIPFIYLTISVFVFYKPKIVPSILKILFILTVYIITAYALLLGSIVLIAFFLKFNTSVNFNV